MGSLLVRGGFVLDLDQPFERADILIEGSRIARIDSTLEVEADRRPVADVQRQRAVLDGGHREAE